MSDEDYIGRQFGNYSIIEFISRGTFGGVYKAKHTYFEDDPIVAIKILHPQFGSSEERAQFITEAQLLRKLKHPFILPVMDVGFQNDVLYMIIQYAEGGTLRNRIYKQAGQPFPIVETIRIITQVGETLQYAHQHEQHIVHCDLKPENILFNAQGNALLADFGIAVILGTTGTKLLSKGGTLGYMAPEQFKGLVSPKIDQYALGCIAYELFAGRHPYNLRGANASVAEYQHSNVEPVASSTYNPQLPAHIETAIKTAMAKDRNNRYSNVAAFLAALQKTVFSQPATQPVISQPSTVPITLPPSVGRHPNNLLQTSPDPIEQLFQRGVRAHAMRRHSNKNAEKAFHLWRQIMMTPGVDEQYRITARNSIRELREQMIPLRLKQAREASLQGRWQDEIRLWEDLLALEPSEQELAHLLNMPLTLDKYFNNLQSVQHRLQIAQQNVQFTRMYTGVEEHIHNNSIDDARNQLQMLWRDAPYYGDPAGLAQIIGIAAAMNYEQAIIAEQVRLEEQKRQERVRQEQERLALLIQKDEIEEQERNKNILMIVIGTIVLLGAGAEGVRVGIWGIVTGAVETTLGAVGVVITGDMALGVLAGILAVVLAAAKDEDEILKGGCAVLAIVTGLGGLVLAIVTGLEGDIVYGIMEGVGCILLAIAVYWATVFVSVVVFGIIYGISYIAAFIIAKILEAAKAVSE